MTKTAATVYNPNTKGNNMAKATDSLDGYSDADHARALGKLAQDIANAPAPNIVVVIEGGCCVDVEGLPDGWTYTIDDRDCEDGNDEQGDNMTDAEADADTLRSAGMGTDEDYGDFGDCFGEDYH